MQCLADYEKKAIENLSEKARFYYIGGADDEESLRDNVKAFRRIKLRPRMLRGVTEVDLSTTVLGQKISMPICVAPTAFQKLAHPDGEVATVTACAKSNTVACISTYASSSIEDLNKAPLKGIRWLHLYILRNVTVMKNLISKAERSGFTAIVLTVDAPISGNRRATADPEFYKGLGIAMITSNGGVLETRPEKVLDDTITWKTISWLKSITKLPIVVKGILTAEDAKLAVQHGADAIVVSNHGGRQLDGVLAGIDALPEVVSAVNGQVEVYMDGGVRLGTDVLKALALGARAVFIGRPVLWGLAVQGADGVHQILEMLRTELRTAMVLSGCQSARDIPRSLVTSLWTSQL